MSGPNLMKKPGRHFDHRKTTKKTRIFLTTTKKIPEQFRSGLKRSNRVEQKKPLTLKCYLNIKEGNHK